MPGLTRSFTTTKERWVYRGKKCTVAKQDMKLMKTCISFPVTDSTGRTYRRAEDS